MEVRFYAAKNAKNCLLGFAGQRPYIIAFVAIEGTPRAPVDTLRNNMPSTPHGKADRRTLGVPRGVPWVLLGSAAQASPAPPCAPQAPEIGPLCPGGGYHGAWVG